jgi:hypothetical protein
MIDLEAVIRHFGPRAVKSLKKHAESGDSIAIEAMKSKLEPGVDRVTKIRCWLRDYNVFQGIDDPRRIAITKAVLCWRSSTRAP